MPDPGRGPAATQAMGSLDRRLAPRVARRLSAVIGPARERLPAETRDASATGLLLATATSVPVGARVTLAVELDAEVHLVRGRVVRVLEGAEPSPYLLAVELDVPAQWRHAIGA